MRQEEDRFLEEENEQTFIDNAAVEHYISILLTTYKVLLSPILQRRNWGTKQLPHLKSER